MPGAPLASVSQGIQFGYPDLFCGHRLTYCESPSLLNARREAGAAGAS